MSIYSFFELENTKISRLNDDVKLDTLLFEKEMKQYNGGLDLTKITSKTNIDSQKYLKFVPHFYDPNDDLDHIAVQRTLNKHSTVFGPSAMIVDSIEDLSKHMSVAYQVSHFHYILGKKYNLKDSFPESCCGVSARNVTLSLIELGYANAADAFGIKHDHDYVILPFVLPNKDIYGTIIVDPTYDQRWGTCDVKELNLRNVVLLKLGSEWKYTREKEHDLFPNGVCSIDILRTIGDTSCAFEKCHNNTKRYLEKAFSNPITINPEYTFTNISLPKL